MLWIYLTVESKPPVGYPGAVIKQELKISQSVENAQEACALIEAAMVEIERVFDKE